VTRFRGGLGSTTLKVGLDDFTGLFQPKQFYDSVVAKARKMIVPSRRS